MITKQLHHVGVILPSMERVEAFMAMYGLQKESQGQTDYGGEIVFATASAGDCPVEFIVPNGGKLAQFNGGKGGIHHICYEVDDLEAASARLRAQGALLLEKESVCGGPHAIINFVRPASSHGVLVELMQIDPSFPA